MSEFSARTKVLIADDEEVIADTLALILNQGGFEARAVYSGEKAVEIAPAFQPDVLISDVLFADLNGMDTAIRIRSMLPNLRVVLLTGQTATADIVAKSKALNLGFDVLTKPVHPKELIKKLKNAA